MEKRAWTPEEDAILIALMGESGIQYEDIAQLLHRSVPQVNSRLKVLRRHGVTLYIRDIAAPVEQYTRKDPAMARRIGASKVQAEVIKVIRGQGWTISYTGNNHIMCKGPSRPDGTTPTVLISAAPGYDAKSDFRKHGVVFPGDEVRQQTKLAATRYADKPQTHNVEVERIEVDGQDIDPATLAAREEMPANEAREQSKEPITMDLLARSIESLSEMIEVIAEEVASLRTTLYGKTSDVDVIGNVIHAQDALSLRLDRVEQRIDDIKQADPVGALRARLRGG